MDDREMLKLAAKAAGLKLDGESPWGGFWVWNDIALMHAVWSPLADDGDALRLAVKLGLAVDCFVPEWAEAPRHNFTMVLYGPRVKGRLTDRCSEDHGADPYAATRRAITRAAAEIGKRMGQQTEGEKG